MPDIILKVVSVDAALPAQAFARSFDAGGGTIGRDESNTLSLPDKHRRVSRLHATVSFPAGVPTITNSSTSLPISVGEQQLDFGESMPIIHGALVEIGPYILQAHSLSLDASPVPIQMQDALIPAPLYAVAAARHPTGMTVVLPPPVAAPPMAPAAYAVPYSAQRPSPSPVEPLPASFLGNSDLSDLLGGVSSPPTAAPPTFAAPTQTPVPVYAPPQSQPANSPPSNASPVPATHFAPASADHDPFAELLAGIGGSAAVPTRGNFAGPTNSTQTLTPSGLSADPLAAFGGTAASSFGSAPPSVVRADTIPEQLSPFDLPSSTGRNDADPLSALLGGSVQTQNTSANQGAHVAPSIDSLFQSAPAGSADAALFGLSPQRPATDGTLESLIRTDTGSDPLSLFDGSGAAPAATARAMRNDSFEIGSAFQPPLPMQARPFVADVAPAAAPLPFNPLAAHSVVSAPTSAPARAVLMAASATPDVLTEAFLRGASLNASALPNGLTPEIMTTIGSLLRSATAGAIDMLAARAATKREVQASVTIISVQANNPLKFLPNADSALLQLLGKKMPGFMRADVAMKDAFEDLRAHEVGVIAGTRAALTEVLGKFDPAVLGDKLTKGSVLESLMPSARKAKLWDMYLERYLQIRREAEDDFQSIFGRAFVQAYELETARIKGDTSGSGGER